MAIRFHDTTEAATVDAGRKKTGRPSYYNADDKLETEISSDFEAVLILVPDSAREQARTKTSQQTPKNERQRKRDSVLRAALRVDGDNATAKYEELQDATSDLSSFKEQFGEYASVGEVGLLLRDAQLGEDEVVLAMERAKHQMVCVSVLAERLSNQGISEDLEKERKSWSAVLSEYSGF
jgi:hypothetical protein